MAKIFISYSNKDKEFIQPYLQELEKNGHKILIDDSLLKVGGRFQTVLREALQNADGTIIFLTENSIESPNVISELGMAFGYFDNKQKFLIPLVKGDLKLPAIIQDIFYLSLDQKDPVIIVKEINEAIQAFGNTHQMTPASFAESLFAYLNKLQIDSKFDSWVYYGHTDTAYGNPVGAWKTDGFLFESGDYSFILRSVSRVDLNNDASYLVVESNNLEGQLANLALSNSDKFVNVNGQVTIFETYDMTVGARRSRKEVKEAFEKVGYNNNVITSFNEKEFSWRKILLDILQWSVFREKAKILLLADPSASSEENINTNFWFLKIYGDNWNLPGIKENDTGHFNSHFNSYDKRPDYEYFVEVKPGDKGVAFDYSSRKGIAFFFEVTERLHYDEQREEIFSFKISRKLENAVDISSVSKLLIFESELTRESRLKLFPLTPSEYNSIVALAGARGENETEPFRVLNKPTFSEVFADIATKDLKDELGFEKDVHALASVIALKDVKPPLAVGLFGNWGSGKSFFMNKLQQQIEILSGNAGDIFCKKVLQINFNSWHYSDSNLWASLITKIFEDLEEYGKGKPNELNELFKNLNSTKELLLETENEKAKIDKEIDVLKGQRKVFEETVRKQSNDLRSLNNKDVLTALLNDTSVNEDIQKLKSEYSFLNLKEYDDIEKKLQELNNFSTRSSETFKLALSYIKGKKTFIALLFVVLIAVGCWALIKNSGFIKQYLGNYKAFICMVSGALGLFLQFLQPAIKVMNIAFRRITSLHQTIEILKEKANAKVIHEKELLDKKLSTAQAELGEIQKQIDLLEVQQKKLKDDINDISTGRKIIRFIESRVMDERYLNNLGIISWIRKDFEQLDRLLLQQKEARLKLGKQANASNGLFELDRIILYIDDLDRCSEPLVVKVLEAIHLLLAFPLFVVIVGVDPRWMHKALNVQYSKLLSVPEPLIGGNDNLVSPENNHLGTSYDYLEKIFQIPFSLRQMNDTGKRNLIESQFKLTAISKPDNQPSIPKPLVLDQALQKTDTSTIEEPFPEEVEQQVRPEAVNATEETKSSTAINPEKLRITDEEIQFMKEIVFIIGDSPRTIKRYINIYRIIRTHSTFETEPNEQLIYYFGAIILLAVMSGMPNNAQLFFEQLSKAEDDLKFTQFLDNYISKDQSADSKFSKLSGRLKNIGIGQLKIKEMELHHFQANINLISRFSFRNIVDENEM